VAAREITRKFDQRPAENESSMPRTTPDKRSLSVVASRLNGSSRQRFAHEIQPLSISSAFCGQLLCTATL
jgi:hypothetical protein